MCMYVLYLPYILPSIHIREYTDLPTCNVSVPFLYTMFHTETKSHTESTYTMRIVDFSYMYEVLKLSDIYWSFSFAMEK